MTMLARNNRYPLVAVLLVVGLAVLWAHPFPARASITLVGVTVTEKQVNGNTVMLIEWETATEIDTAGFYIQRRNGAGDAFERISGSLIPSQGDGAIGAVYSFEDTSPGSNPEYILEDVSNANISTNHGPYKPASDTTASPQPGSNDPTATPRSNNTPANNTPTNTPQPTTVVGATNTPQPTSAVATSTPQPTSTSESGGNDDGGNDDDSNGSGSNPGVSSDPTPTLTAVPTTSSNNNTSNNRGGSSNPTSIPPTPTPTDIVGVAPPTATRAPFPPANPYTPPDSVAQTDPDPFVLDEGSDGAPPARSAPGTSSRIPTAAPPIVSVPTSVAPGNNGGNNASRSQATLTPATNGTRAPAYYPPPGIAGSFPGSGATAPQVPSSPAMPPVAAGDTAPTPNAAGRALLQNPEFSDQQPTTAELATAPNGGNGIWFVAAGLLFGLALLTGGGTLLLWQLDRRRRRATGADLPAYPDDSNTHAQHDDDIF